MNIGELERLSELHRSGALTDDEFHAAKQQLIASPAGVSDGGPGDAPSRDVGGEAPASVPARDRKSSAGGSAGGGGDADRMGWGGWAAVAAASAVFVGAMVLGGDPVDEFCGRMPEMPGEALSAEIVQAARDREMTSGEFRAALKERCAEAYDDATGRATRAAKHARSPSYAPLPPDNTQERLEEQRARAATECMARGPDYRFTEFGGCVFDPG